MSRLVAAKCTVEYKSANRNFLFSEDSTEPQRNTHHQQYLFAADWAPNYLCFMAVHNKNSSMVGKNSGRFLWKRAEMEKRNRNSHLPFRGSLLNASLSFSLEASRSCRGSVSSSGEFDSLWHTSNACPTVRTIFIAWLWNKCMKM